VVKDNITIHRYPSGDEEGFRKAHRSSRNEDGEFFVGEIVYVYDLPLGRPEQSSWLGLVLSRTGVLSDTKKVKYHSQKARTYTILWNHGNVSSLPGWRLSLAAR
jgi:hypothetical protein